MFALLQFLTLALSCLATPNIYVGNASGEQECGQRTYPYSCGFSGCFSGDSATDINCDNIGQGGSKNATCPDGSKGWDGLKINDACNRLSTLNVYSPSNCLVEGNLVDDNTHKIIGECHGINGPTKNCANVAGSIIVGIALECTLFECGQSA